MTVAAVVVEEEEEEEEEEGTVATSGMCRKGETE